MDKESLQEILNGHVKYIALMVVGINALGIVINAIINHQLSRRLKHYEHEQAISAAKVKTRFDYHFINAGDATKRLLKRTTKAQILAGQVLFLRTIPLMGRTEESDRILNAQAQELQQRFTAILLYFASVQCFLEIGLAESLGKCFESINKVAKGQPDVTEQYHSEWQRDAAERIVVASQAYQRFLLDKAI